MIVVRLAPVPLDDLALDAARAQWADRQHADACRRRDCPTCSANFDAWQLAQARYDAARSQHPVRHIAHDAAWLRRVERDRGRWAA